MTPNVRCPDETPAIDLLERAVTEARSDLLQQWLALGGDVNHPSLTTQRIPTGEFPDGKALLLHAIGDGSESRIELVRLLLEARAKVALHVRPDGGTPLMHAIAASARSVGDVRMAKMLLDAGVDVNARTDGEWSAAHSAARRCDVAMLALLVERGANLDVSNCHGETVFHGAMQCAITNEWLAKRLPGLINAKDRNGSTALHYSVAGARLEVTQVLMAAGADPYIRSASGMNAFEMGRTLKHTKVVAWMENFEAAKAARSAIDDIARQHVNPGRAR